MGFRGNICSMYGMIGLLVATYSIVVDGDLISETMLTSSDNGTMEKDFGNETTKPPILVVDEHSVDAQEKKSSLAIFFILIIIVMATLVVHVLIVTKLYFVPESLAIVILGALIGLMLSYSKRDWTEVETFSPNMFFLVLLPPIIFESGYNLHKGDFFANMFPILSFAILGTMISAFTVGSALYILGQAGLIYKLSAAESFAFGSMISAVDPVATLAIFQALNVDRMLYMLVFGESMLNDAVAIVLTSTALEMSHKNATTPTSSSMLYPAISRFTYVFLISAFLGAFVGLLSALLFKYVDLRKTPSLEFALLLIFAYLPYGLAEAISLSGIMAILFCSVTMSQYTHFNISPITQITMQQTFRTVAFVAETCTFAYLGLALFTIKLEFRPMFILWSILLCFAGRAFNVFPLAFMANKCRRSQISVKNQFIMWYSGMRGAVAFALALHVSVQNEETKLVLLTTTLFIVLFTIVFLGGTTLPVLRILNNMFPKKKKRRRGVRVADTSDKSAVLLSKTQEMFLFDQSEHVSSGAEEMLGSSEGGTYSAASRFNELFVRPLFVRKYTLQELRENRMSMRRITSEALNRDNGHLTRQISSDETSVSSTSTAQPLL